MVHKIAVLSITLLLGSSAVHGGQLPCHQIQKITSERFGFELGDVSPIESSNFDNPIVFEYAKWRRFDENAENAFAVTKSDESLPQITIGSKSYKIFALIIRSIDLARGIANLVVIFSLDGYNTPDQTVVMFVPISLSETADADLNEKLNGDLSALSKLLPRKTHTVASVKWLQPLMEKAIGVNRPLNNPQSQGTSSGTDTAAYSVPNNNSYMTKCVTVSKNSVGTFFKPINERPNTKRVRFVD